MNHSPDGLRPADPDGLPADRIRTDGDDARGRQAMAEQVVDLTQTVRSNRTIGVAVGILVERYGTTPDVAFAYLRRVSQNSNHKLRDLAAELVQTGKLLGRETEDPDGIDLS